MFKKKKKVFLHLLLLYWNLAWHFYQQNERIWMKFLWDAGVDIILSSNKVRTLQMQPGLKAPWEKNKKTDEKGTSA